VIFVIGVLLAIFLIPWPWGLLVVLGALALEVFEIRWGLRLARGRSQVGIETLVGKRGRAATDLDPRGQVFIDGARWAARSSHGVHSGTTIEVREVHGLELYVDPVFPGPQDATEDPL
jgi:membrane-bound serine protease (ClpP class)